MYHRHAHDQSDEGNTLAVVSSSQVCLVYVKLTKANQHDPLNMVLIK